ncbi:hypothetical protein [Nonomuraea rosea]|uniref:hypothetical protein n=1 Tax=Nonomuraea rosea TaxID=638574 RepID=UPI0031EB96D4
MNDLCPEPGWNPITLAPELSQLAAVLTVIVLIRVRLRRTPATKDLSRRLSKGIFGTVRYAFATAVALGLLLAYADDYWNPTPGWLAVAVIVIALPASAPVLIRLVHAVPRAAARRPAPSPERTNGPPRPAVLAVLAVLAWAVLRRLR